MSSIKNITFYLKKEILGCERIERGGGKRGHEKSRKRSYGQERDSEINSTTIALYHF